MSQAGEINTAAGPVPPSVATSYVLDVGTAVPSANVLKVNGGAGVQTSLGLSNQIIVTVQTSGFTWTEQSTSPYAIPVENGVFCNASMTVNLPTASLITGSSVIIYNDFGANVTVQAGAGQLIQFGAHQSSVAGTATSIDQGDILELVYKSSDTAWHVIATVGSWTLA